MKRRWLYPEKRSLALWTVIILLVCILPLNLLALYSSNTVTQNVREQIHLAVKNVMDMEMERLNIILTKADDYLYKLMLSEKGRAVRWPENQLQFQNVRIWVMRDMNDNIPSSDYASGYFVCTAHDFEGENNDEDNLLLSGTTDARDVFRTVLSSADGRASVGRKWMVMTIDGREFLVHKSVMSGTYYGAFVDFSAWKDHVFSQLSYEQKELITQEGAYEIKKDWIQVEETLPKLEWRIICNVMEPEFILWKWQQLMAILLCFLCAPVIYILFHRFILGGFKELENAHNQYEEGNRDYRITKKAAFRELDASFASFNKMVENVRDLRLANMEKEMDKQRLELSNKELEIINLQLQIHPHFLLNTFNMIYNLVAQGDVKNTQKTILYLSDYFRYLFRNGRKLPRFGKELDLIEAYIEIAKTRYPGKVEAVFEIDEDMMLVHVPPLLIHNFVENCVKHALRNDKSVCIILSAEYTDGWVDVEISDDGRGMPENVVKAINEDALDDVEEGKNVGIQNSVKRLRAIYGSDAFVHAESKLGEGTSIHIRFPYDLGVMEK